VVGVCAHYNRLPYAITMESHSSMLADFLKSAQTNDAIFYGIPLQHSDNRGLAHLLGLQQDPYTDLLSCLGILKYNPKRDSWQFSEKHFLSFMSLHSLGDFCGLYYFRYQGKARSPFIRIGNFPEGMEKHSLAPPTDRELPSIKDLAALQQKFEENLTAIKQTAQKPPPAAPSTPANEKENEKEEVGQNTILKVCLERQLLPLLFDAKILASAKFLRKDIPLDEVANVVLRVASQLTADRHKKRSEVIRESEMSHNQDLLLPTFAEFGIPAENKSVVSGLLRDIITLDNHSPKHNLLRTRMANDQVVTLVRIPQSISLDRLERNDRISDFVGQTMEAIVAPPEAVQKAKNQAGVSADDHRLYIKNKDDAVTSLLIYLGKKYRNNYNAACANLGLSNAEVMDAISTFAMWSSANVNYAQQREIARHLRVWFQRQVVCAEEKVKDLLGNDFVAPEITGTYVHNKEKIPWNYRNPKALFLKYINAVLNSKDDVKASQLHHIDISVSIDHGKLFSRAVAVFVCRRQSEAGRWTQFQDTFLLASAECAKDSEVILQNTFMPHVNAGFQVLQQSKHLNVYVCAETERKYACLDGDPTEAEVDTIGYAPINLECHVAGDIAQFFMNQGREAYSSKWCPYCNLSHKAWQVQGHTAGRLWTNDLLKAHCMIVHEGMLPAERMGVASEPIFTAIDLPNTMPPLLHIQLGAVNTIAKNVISEIQATCEKWSVKYLELEGKKTRLNSDLRILKQTRNDSQKDDKKRITALQRKLKEAIATEEEQGELTLLRQKVVLLKKHIETSEKSLKAVKTAFEEEEKQPENTKATGQPVRAAVEDIWQGHGINRGVYFGGDLQGEAVRKMMAEREAINEDYKTMILQLPEEQKTIKENHTWDILDCYERLLGHLDSFFSICRTKRFHITEQQIKDASEHREHILALWRALGLSVTTKIHIIEDHVIEYLVRLKGFGDLCEDEGERGHQMGAQNENRSKALRDHTEKAKAHAQWECMNKNEDVQKRKMDVQKAVARKRNLNVGVENAKKRKMERDGKRNQLLSLNLVTTKLETLREQKEALYMKNGTVRTDIFDENFVVE
jgi:hypothetical protein